MNQLTIALLLLVANAPLIGQDWTNSTNTLLDFSLQSSAGILDRLDTYEPTTEREKDLFSRCQDSLSQRLQRFALEPFYAELVNTGITLAPKEALSDYLTYGDDGLPSILFPRRSIKRLANKGYISDYFFYAKINVTASGILGGTSERVKPKASCQIKVFDAAGEEVRNVEAEVLASSFIKNTEFPKLTFDKLGFDYVENLQSRLEPLVLQAVKEAIAKL